MRFLTSSFFHDSNSSRFRFHRDIWIFKKLCSVHPIAESDSVVCIIPRSQTPRCAAHRGVKLRGVHSTAESSSVVCITPRSQTAHRGVKIERCDQISRRNRNRIQKYFSLLIRGPDGFESWKKNWRLKISWHTPFKNMQKRFHKLFCFCKDIW